MKYPKLVPERLCKVPIKVHLESEEISNLGESSKVLDLDLLCNYQDKAKTIFTAEQKIVTIAGSAMFDGDIAPDFAILSGGTVEIFGVIRKIEQGMKARNPDGTVNYTRLDVI